MKQSEFSVLIIGSGISGLYAAIKIAENDAIENILLVTKSRLRESNSRYAQGGIVGVLPNNKQDSVSLHVKDTLKAGAGLSDFNVARFISEESAGLINDLVKYGVNFDKEDNKNFALTLEGAHSVKRILHAGGDATGKSIELTLSAKAEQNKKITIYEQTQAVELLIDSNGNCKGAIVLDTETNEYEVIHSPATVIATGGFGQVYSNTTNPSIATGDGIALAYRANALMQNMEFVQFHPTALAINGTDTRFLISESVRGEGAKLRNLKGEYFTFKYDELGDLASRDIVTRAIYFEMQEADTPCVKLDTTLIEKEKLEERFPNIFAVCKEHGIDISNDAIPVSPAAHYAMGGIKTATNGKTTVPGLYAIGEAGCTSLHGANRLASNSLLECVVTSNELAKYLSTQELSTEIIKDSKIETLLNNFETTANLMIVGDDDSINLRVINLTSRLKKLMWEKVGIVRNETSLIEAEKEINEIKNQFGKVDFCSTLTEYELRNMLIIADLIVKAALSRKESRGAHYRSDYPKTLSEACHSFLQKGDIDKHALSFA